MSVRLAEEPRPPSGVGSCQHRERHKKELQQGAEGVARVKVIIL